MLVDTHVHFAEYDSGEIPELIARARDAGVDRYVAVGGDSESNRVCLSLARQWGKWMVCAVGFDRNQAPGDVDMAALHDMLADPACAAVGETGLDYHYGRDRAAEQRRLLDTMLQAAQEAGLPVVVHSREAEADTLAALRPFAEEYRTRGRLPGVLHCFTGTRKFMEELVQMGFFISFSGIVTFRSAQDLRLTAAAVPAENLLLETDSPLLAPEPLRGHRNEPAFLPRIAEAVAAARDSDVSTVAEQTTANALRLFFGCAPADSRSNRLQ